MAKNKKPLTGAESAALAMKQINPDVVAAYPITPQTDIMHSFSQYVADGKVDTELIRVESEHSAMSACVGASASGARVMTASSSQGIALMHEIIYIASSTRLPIVMNVVNRALSGPINIHCDHSDTMAERDSGWIQLYCETAQEVYDLNLLGLKLAEHKDILLPVMICQDGFITSHTVEPVKTLENKKVKKYVGNYKPKYSLLDVDNPITIGPIDFYDYYFEHKRQQVNAMEKTRKFYPKIAKEFKKISGKYYDVVEEYQLKDADYAIVVMSSTAGTTKEVIDELRKQGKKVGLLRIRMFRPFPEEVIVKKLKNKKAVAVLDRAVSFGAEAPLFSEVRAGFYEEKNKPKMSSYVFGLGGRETRPSMIKKVFNEIEKGKAKKENYLGVRNG